MVTLILRKLGPFQACRAVQVAPATHWANCRFKVCGASDVQVYFSQFQRTPFGMLRLDPQASPAGCAFQCLCCYSWPVLPKSVGVHALGHAQQLGRATDLCCVPQDMGPGYRNVIGIPGGVRSPLFRVLQVRSLLYFR